LYLKGRPQELPLSAGYQNNLADFLKMNFSKLKVVHLLLKFAGLAQVESLKKELEKKAESNLDSAFGSNKVLKTFDFQT
jgi:hypothetical protein